MIVKSEALGGRGRRTRAALVLAGREAFEERGYDAVRVDDVCARAGVSHGTFYTYFGSREELFREVAAAVVGEMFTASLVGPATGDDPYARIEAANLLYLRAWSSNSRLVRMLEQVAITDEGFRDLLLELREVFVRRGAEGLRRLQEQGLADPSLDPRLTAVMLGGMVEHFAHVWLDLGERADEETAVALLSTLWARAIGLTPAPGGRAAAPDTDTDTGTGTAPGAGRATGRTGNLTATSTTTSPMTEEARP
ncbi:TetR/AcrR family transcriptional regulator [Streptosporangium sp. NPDC023615]|uniref:TetR/AcrR family transcriptional regulator n=1 Tax=Streptosporangium sp. NPDC023615 TaxID=3154794 RepID=UPI003441D277